MLIMSLNTSCVFNWLIWEYRIQKTFLLIFYGQKTFYRPLKTENLLQVSSYSYKTFCKFSINRFSIRGILWFSLSRMPSTGHLQTGDLHISLSQVFYKQKILYGPLCVGRRPLQVFYRVISYYKSSRPSRLSVGFLLGPFCNINTFLDIISHQCNQAAKKLCQNVIFLCNFQCVYWKDQGNIKSDLKAVQNQRQLSI